MTAGTWTTMQRMGKLYRDAQRRIHAHRSAVCSCEPIALDRTRRDPHCPIHGDRADVARPGGFVCPACVQFGRSQCMQHAATSIAALERLTDDTVPS